MALGIYFDEDGRMIARRGQSFTKNTSPMYTDVRLIVTTQWEDQTAKIKEEEER
jgi:hypothetical protein